MASARRSPSSDDEDLVRLLREELHSEPLPDPPPAGPPAEPGGAEPAPGLANIIASDVAQAPPSGAVGILGVAPTSRAVSSTGGSSIRVAVRVRPLPPGEPSIIEVMSQGSVAIRKEAATGGNEYLASQQGRTEERSFDRVFGPRAAQAEVYAWSCRPLVDAAVVEGRSATVLVYGATGAGKTHTMFGERDANEQGLIYRTVRDVFESIERHGEASSSSSCPSQPGRAEQPLEVRVSFLELYNEKIFDLLQEGSAGAGGTPCSIMEDERRGLVRISNLREVPARSAEEALQQLHTGLQLRKVDSTAANLRSSRSHAVFELRLERRGAEGRPGEAEERRFHSKICLIDLAGSERASQTQNTGAALRDGAKINQSLLALANCINALGERGRGERQRGDGPPMRDKTPQRKPPYRDSKLTLLLKSSLVSDGLVSMIANVHPGRDHFEDSNNTLEYAKRTTTVSRPALVRPEPRESSTSAPVRRAAQPSPPPSPSPGHFRAVQHAPGAQNGNAEFRQPPADCPPRPRKKSAGRAPGGGAEGAAAGGGARRLPPPPGLPAQQGGASGGGGPGLVPAPRPGSAAVPSGGQGLARSHSEGPQTRVVAEAILRGRTPQVVPDDRTRQPAVPEDGAAEPPPASALAAARAGLSSPGAACRPPGRARSVPHPPASASPQAPRAAPPAQGQPPAGNLASPLGRRPQRSDGVSALLAGMRGAGALVVEGPPPLAADREVLLRIVESLQAEKAAMDLRLSAVMADRDRLEAECGRLRAANLEKDRQLALVLGGVAPSRGGAAPGVAGEAQTPTPHAECGGDVAAAAAAEPPR